jgi:hypothetical protein
MTLILKITINRIGYTLYSKPRLQLIINPGFLFCDMKLIIRQADQEMYECKKRMKVTRE